MPPRTTFPSRPTDGARSILDPRYRGGPDQSPERNEAALIDATADALLYDGGGCVQVPFGEHLVNPGSVEPKEGVLWRGVAGQTILRSSEFETTSLFSTSQNGWSSHDIIYAGGRDLTLVSGGPSILVLNDVSGVEIIGSLRNPMNNGIVARGPGISKCRFVLDGCFGSGVGFDHGGGHMVALTGDGLDLPFDVKNCQVRVTGWDIINGGVNCGSSDKLYVEVIIWNDLDETLGPPVTGVAALRLANGTRSVRGFVIAHACGRGLRLGPTDDAQLQVWAKHCSYEAVLLAGGPYTAGGWRGGDSRIEITQINCDMLAGGDGTRAKSHAGTTVTIDSINLAGSTALAGTATSVPVNDDDLPEAKTVNVVHAYWDNFERYRWKIVDHVVNPVGPVLDPTRIDVTVFRETVGYDVTVASFTCGQNNDAFVTALMASVWPADAVNGRAYVMSAPGLPMQRSTGGRNGPMDHRLRIGDIGAFLAADLVAGQVTSTLTVQGGQGIDIADDPSGETHYPFVGELRDATSNRREVVRFDGRTRRLSITGGPHGGVVNIAVNDEAVAVPYNASAATLTTLLGATRAGAAGVTVTGGPLPGAVVFFAFTQPYVNVRKVSDALTTGTSPASTIDGDVFQVTRAQAGTTALAWATSASAVVYCHPSDIFDAGGRSERMGTDSVNAASPARLCRVDTFALRTDESNVRGVSSGTLFPPLGLGLIHVSTATTVQWITGRMAKRELTLYADVDNVVLQHGTGNLKLAGQRDLTLMTGQTVHLICDDNGDQWVEQGINERDARYVDLGSVSGAQSLALLPGDRVVYAILTLTGDTTYTLTGLRPGVSIVWSVTQGGSGGYSLFFSPTPRKANTGAALAYSTAVGKTDDVETHTRNGTGLTAYMLGKDMA